MGCLKREGDLPPADARPRRPGWPERNAGRINSFREWRFHGEDRCEPGGWSSSRLNRAVDKKPGGGYLETTRELLLLCSTAAGFAVSALAIFWGVQGPVGEFPGLSRVDGNGGIGPGRGPGAGDTTSG